MDWATIYADVQENYLIYGSIPIVAAILGYVTKVAAVKMMFYPMKFMGIRPFFGQALRRGSREPWQDVEHANRNPGLYSGMLRPAWARR